MCDDIVADYDEPRADPARDPVLNPHGSHPSRRSVLTGIAGLAAAPFLPTGRTAAAASSQTLTGADPIISAMHVHAAWSEQSASWEAQFAQAAALGVDLLYMSDHDFRQTADNYITSLKGVALVTSHTGSLAQQAATNSAGTVRLLAASRNASPAGVSMAVRANPVAVQRLRTSIAGQQLTVTFTSVRLDAGATFEARVSLSTHPAYGTRPAGQFELRYQFGASAPARYLAGGGLVGIVALPAPAAGSSATFDLTADVQSLWPDMLALDNGFVMLTLVATSPASGSVADIKVTVGITRTQNDAASVIANQQVVIDTYGPRYPAMAVWPTTEISRLDPHVIPFGVPAFIPDQALVTTAAAYYPQMAAEVHAQGGVVSWNHPFGTTAGPLLSQSQQDANRRSIFSSMLANGRYGTDLLEVGYAVRGQASIASHLALWDTFSRRAICITGTGVNDDHLGLHWSTLQNGFMTGIWAASVAQPDVASALKAGRAYTYHAGKWPGAALDMAVDGVVPMGSVSMGSADSRTLVVSATPLPSGSRVEVVSGVVDYAGTDPLTSVVATIPAATFGTSGTASVSVNTSSSCFVRAQVRNSAGALVGVGNPIWLLRDPAAAGVPAERAA